MGSFMAEIPVNARPPCRVVLEGRFFLIWVCAACPLFGRSIVDRYFGFSVRGVACGFLGVSGAFRLCVVGPFICLVVATRGVCRP